MSGPFAGTIKELCGQRFRKCVESPQRWIESPKIRIIARLMNLKRMDDTNRRSEKDPTFRRRIIEEFKNLSNN